MRRFLTFPLYIFFLIFTPVYRRKVSKHLVSLCKDGSNILDVGCGDGEIGKIMMDINPTLEIEGVDIKDYGAKSLIKKTYYNGQKLPFPDKSFDIVIAVDVLHHTQCIPVHLKEIRRVSKRYVILKDHKTYGFWSHLLISFTDYITNVPFGIYCAFNFPTWNEWLGYFDILGFKVDRDMKGIDFGFGIDDTYNFIARLKLVESK